MKLDELYQNLANLKEEYLRAENNYKKYLKNIEQYCLFLDRVYEYICRLLVNKKYQEIDGEAYFQENQEFIFATNLLDYSLDLVSWIDNLITQNKIGKCQIIPSEDSTKPLQLKVIFNPGQKIKNVEQIIQNLKNSQELEKEVISR